MDPQKIGPALLFALGIAHGQIPSPTVATKTCKTSEGYAWTLEGYSNTAYPDSTCPVYVEVSIGPSAYQPSAQIKRLWLYGDDSVVCKYCGFVFPRTGLAEDDDGLQECPPGALDGADAHAKTLDTPAPAGNNPFQNLDPEINPDSVRAAPPVPVAPDTVAPQKSPVGRPFQGELLLPEPSTISLNPYGFDLPLALECSVELFRKK